MPIHHFLPEHALVARGLTNYWGYNTLAFFAPHSGYAATGTRGHQVQEFKTMVKALHQAGIEVILDVVYNHTAEGDHMGPALSLRGIDNLAYYRVREDNPRYYLDYTGCGNSLNVRHPHSLQLIMDSLRYWVLEMHVDGFRFDLASALAREFHDVDRLSTFFDIVQQDPVISQVKLIAEPWDVGPAATSRNFPPLWTEWNGKYRDTVRDFWRGYPVLPELASRISGSSDLYQADGRRPVASINFVTCHDGFTLADLVSYDRKHNEANGEDNRDGTDDNRSWNHGTEGPTTDPAIATLRRRQMRNMLTTLMLSQGVPMLSHGDEIGRTQHGNNNAYCQDNPISWVDWDSPAQRRPQVHRRSHRTAPQAPIFRRTRFFAGSPIRSGDELRDSLVHRRGQGDDRTGASGSAAAWSCSSTATASPTGRPRPAHQRRLVPAVLQRPRPRRGGGRAGQAYGAVDGGGRHRHRAGVTPAKPAPARETGTARAWSRPRSASRCARGRCCCCAAPAPERERPRNGEGARSG